MFFVLTLICILFLFTLTGVVLLFTSTDNASLDSESTTIEKKIIQEIRKMEKADKAVLKYLSLKDKKGRQKTIKIGKLPLGPKEELTVNDLRENRLVNRRRIKIKV